MNERIPERERIADRKEALETLPVGTTAVAPCVVPDEWLGVRRHHSDDRVTIYHGSVDGPITACGFHATFYLEECYRAARRDKTHV